MKHYLRSGATGYMYWNISNDLGGLSTWGWAQNALVSVDTVAKTYRYNHDYYLLKHLTHFVDVGAKAVDVSGTCDDALSFVNPTGAVVVLLRNELSHSQMVQVQALDRTLTVELPPDSISTLAVKPS
jgi:glucosylceramidase